MEMKFVMAATLLVCVANVADACRYTETNGRVKMTPEQYDSVSGPMEGAFRGAVRTKGGRVDAVDMTILLGNLWQMRVGECSDRSGWESPEAFTAAVIAAHGNRGTLWGYESLGQIVTTHGLKLPGFSGSTRSTQAASRPATTQTTARPRAAQQPRRQPAPVRHNVVPGCPSCVKE